MCSYSLYKETFSIFLTVMILHSCYCFRNRGSECPEMHKRTFEGYIPNGNHTAGNYRFFENITELEGCISKCCKNKTCNAAFMYNENCYNLDCESNEMCIPKLHHNPKLRDNVTMVLIRPEHNNNSWGNILESQGNNQRNLNTEAFEFEFFFNSDKKNENWKEFCPKLYEYTYRGYLPRGNVSAGNFSYVEGITKFKKCILNCCDNDKCNVAIMNNKKCYNVHCKSSKLCLPYLHHNGTLRKSLKMVLVKPVNRRDQWKEILDKFNESEDNESSEEILPEISSREEMTTNPTIAWKNSLGMLSDIKLRLPEWDSEVDRRRKKLNIEWMQKEGPTKLEFLKKNETSFDIKKIIAGDYLIKLSIREEKSVNITDQHKIEDTTERESETTTLNENHLEGINKKTV